MGSQTLSVNITCIYIDTLKTCKVDSIMSIELWVEGMNIEDHKLATFRDALAAAAIRCTNFQQYETCREGSDLKLCASRVVYPIESLAHLDNRQGCRYILPGSFSFALSESFVKRRHSETASCSSA